MMMGQLMVLRGQLAQLQRELERFAVTEAADSALNQIRFHQACQGQASAHSLEALPKLEFKDSFLIAPLLAALSATGDLIDAEINLWHSENFPPEL